MLPRSVILVDGAALRGVGARHWRGPRASWVAVPVFRDLQSSRGGVPVGDRRRAFRIVDFRSDAAAASVEAAAVLSIAFAPVDALPQDAAQARHSSQTSHRRRNS